MSTEDQPSADHDDLAGWKPGEAEDLLVGRTLMDRYAVVRKLGEGGMGAVYLARHVTLEKEVALKVLHSGYSRKRDLVQRFLQEAKTASRIRHENVIDITDFGATPDGYVFFAMELLQGHDLAEELNRAKLDGGVLPWHRSAKIFLQISSALSAAHKHGIIHRDLKPENIFLIDRMGQGDFVKLLDFGIAKETEVGEEHRKLTKTGMLFGTPEYMAPEQARGEKPDNRVDVYAMGCILYQLIAGHVPFESDNFMAVLSAHITQVPPRLRPDELARAGAPAEMAEVVAIALAKDREQRFATIDLLADALRRACGETLRQHGITQPPPFAAGATGSRPVVGGTGPAPVHRGTGPATVIGTGPYRARSASSGPPLTGALAAQAGPSRSRWPIAIAALALAAAAVVVALILSHGGGGGSAAAPTPTAPITSATQPGATPATVPTPGGTSAAATAGRPTPGEGTGTPGSGERHKPATGHLVGTPSGTATGTPSGTATGTPSGTPTGTPTGTHTGTPTGTHTGTPGEPGDEGDPTIGDVQTKPFDPGAGSDKPAAGSDKPATEKPKK